METKIRCNSCGSTIGLSEAIINAIKNNPEEIKKIAIAGLEFAKLSGGVAYDICSFVVSTYARFIPMRGFIDNSLESIANGAEFACPKCKSVGCWLSYSEFSAPVTMSIGQLKHLMGLLHKLMGETLEQLARLEELLVGKDNKSGAIAEDLIIERKSLWSKVIDVDARLKKTEQSHAGFLQKLNIVESVWSEWNPLVIYLTLVNESPVVSVIVGKKLRIELVNALKHLAKIEKDFAKIAEYKEKDEETEEAKQDDYRSTMSERAFCHIHLMVIKNQLEELKNLKQNSSPLMITKQGCNIVESEVIS